MSSAQQELSVRLPAAKNTPAAHAGYADADIRGMDFRGRDLAGVDFRSAKAGVPRRWLAAIAAGSLLLSAVAGLIIGGAAAATAVAAIGKPGELPVWQQAAMPVLALLTVVLLVRLLLTGGMVSSTVGLASLPALTVLLMVIVGVDRSVPGRLAVLGIGFGGLLAGTVLLSIALATMLSLVGRPWLLFLGVSVLAAPPGPWETVVGFLHPIPITPYVVVRLIVSAAVALAFFGIAAYLAQRSMAGDHRYAVVRAAVVGLVSRRGTSFRGADLTDANFAGATMSFADLRGTTLIRTNWEGARDLDRAYVAGSYLADSRLCRLVVTKQGAGQSFDGQNLEGVNLQGADLAKAGFVGANLSRATLRAANLAGARLVHTQLYDTDLSDATLTGAYIEDWGISTRTRFDAVRCSYVYMHLPTDADPDPMRKPDDSRDFFAEGDFEYFIAPIIGTLEYYHRQQSDPRAVGRAGKTLDLIQQQNGGQAIDAQTSALALQLLAQRYPDAGLEVVSLRAKEGDKVQIRTLVADAAQRSRMSQEFHALCDAVQALPGAERALLFDNIVARDISNRQLGTMVLAAAQDELSYAATSIRPPGRVACLLLASNPINAAYLRLDEEQHAIMQMLRASDYRDVIQLITVPAARPDDLIQALNQYRPKVVQFSGHGDPTGQLIFVDEAGYPAPISASALRAVFAALKDNVRLVILNACYTTEQAGAIGEVVDCIISMSDALSDKAAIAFIASFYRALGFGRSLQNAFDQAVAAIELQGLAEQTIPQLLARPEIDPAQIILVAPDLLAEDRQT